MNTVTAKMKNCKIPHLKYGSAYSIDWMLETNTRSAGDEAGLKKDLNPDYISERCEPGNGHAGIRTLGMVKRN